MINLNFMNICFICGKPKTSSEHKCESTLKPKEKKLFGENLGWQCPQCGNIYSPSVKNCTKCNDIGNFFYLVGMPT